jgi:hypothetical protein
MKRAWEKVIVWFFSFFRKKKAIAVNQPIATRIIKPGVLVWECDTVSGDVRKAEVKVTSKFDNKGRERKKREVVVKPNCMYELAIDGDNAVRKFENRILAAAKSKK